jgi:hypothetical protein
MLLLAGSVLAALYGAVAGQPAVAVIGGLAGLVVLGFSPKLARRRLPRAGLVVLGFAMVVGAAPAPGVIGGDGMGFQFGWSVALAVLLVAACVALFSGTGLSGASTFGGVLFTLMVFSAIAGAAEMWRVRGEVGPDAWVAIEFEGASAAMVPVMLVAAALLVLGGRRDDSGRREEISRSSPAV